MCSEKLILLLVIERFWVEHWNQWKSTVANHNWTTSCACNNLLVRSQHQFVDDDDQERRTAIKPCRHQPQKHWMNWAIWRHFLCHRYCRHLLVALRVGVRVCLWPVHCIPVLSTHLQFVTVCTRDTQTTTERESIWLSNTDRLDSLAHRVVCHVARRVVFSWEGEVTSDRLAFRHLPPNSARFSCATEGALFMSTQLSTDTVSALRKVWVLIWLWKQPSALESRFGLSVRR